MPDSDRMNRYKWEAAIDWNRSWRLIRLWNTCTQMLPLLLRSTEQATTSTNYNKHRQTNSSKFYRIKYS